MDGRCMLPGVDALTGEAAVAYLTVMFDAAERGTGINVRRVTSDAVRAQRGHRASLTRLRHAHARVTAVTRPCGRPRAHRRRLHTGTAPTGRCKARSGPPRRSGGNP